MDRSFEPLITFVGYARNDNYGGNFLDKLALTIRTLASQASDFRVAVEYLIVEWNPPQDTAALRDVLPADIQNPYFRCAVVTAPPLYHTGFLGADIKGFHPSRALNVGYRRAAGQFVSPLSSDVVLSDALFGYIAKHGLDDGKVYRLDRCDVDAAALPPDGAAPEPRAVWLNGLAEKVVTRHENHGMQVSELYGVMPLHTNACGDFTLAPRAIWHQIRGVPEDCPVTCLDIDSIALHAMVHLGLEEQVLPEDCMLFKFSHAKAGYRQKVRAVRHGWRKYLEKIINFIVPGKSNKATLRGVCNVPLREMNGMGFACDSFERNFVLRVKKWRWFGSECKLNARDWGLADVELEKTTI